MGNCSGKTTCKISGFSDLINITVTCSEVFLDSCANDAFLAESALMFAKPNDLDISCGGLGDEEITRSFKREIKSLRQKQIRGPSLRAQSSKNIEEFNAKIASKEDLFETLERILKIETIGRQKNIREREGRLREEMVKKSEHWDKYPDGKQLFGNENEQDGNHQEALKAFERMELFRKRIKTIKEQRAFAFDLEVDRFFIEEAGPKIYKWFGERILKNLERGLLRALMDAGKKRNETWETVAKLIDRTTSFTENEKDVEKENLAKTKKQPNDNTESTKNDTLFGMMDGKTNPFITTNRRTNMKGGKGRRKK